MPVPADWDGPAVRQVLFAMSKGKAHGLDGWFLEEFRLLPEFLLDAMAQLFNRVEGGACWPSAMIAPEGVLLPKGASRHDPMDRRPVWLLPVVYRVWAAGRWRSGWRSGQGLVAWRGLKTRRGPWPFA